MTQPSSIVLSLAKAALAQPVITSSLTRALELRDHATNAQTALLSGLNLPSGSDLQRLERRVRAVGHGLEAIEDALDRAATEVGLGQRLAAIEAQLAAVQALLAAPPAAVEA